MAKVDVPYDLKYYPGSSSWRRPPLHIQERKERQAAEAAKTAKKRKASPETAAFTHGKSQSR